MGKIVRGAQLGGRAYLVEVPAVVREPERRHITEFDERFAGPQDALAFDDPARVFDDAATLDSDDRPVAPSVNWEQVRADARALIATAQAEGEALLQDAAHRARDLVAAASARVAQIESDAHARGLQAGDAAGREAAQAELAEAIASMHELVEGVRAQRNTIIENAEPELVKLAMAIGERIVHDAISAEPNVVLESVRGGLTRLIGRDVVTLRVHPADLEIIRQHRDNIAANNDVEHLRIVEDQRVERGGVVIETEAGTIDAKISTQLREARRTLQTGDTIAAAPAQDARPVLPPAQAS